MAIGALEPTIHRRKPAGRSDKHRNGICPAGRPGYTLLLAAPANATNVALFAQLNFDFIRDITAIAGIIRFPDVVDVNLSVPVHSIPELISYAKANPGKLNFASSGIGSTLHVAGELFKMMAGVDIVHVPYRGGGPALVDLMSGRVQLMFDNLPTSLEFIRAGKLRPLAVTTAARSAVLPDLPTVADFVPGYEASAWYGVVAPKGAPVEVVETLNKAINAMLTDPAASARFTDLGASPLPGSPADFGKLVESETKKWGKVIKFAGIRPE
jgi:tripartite-type tricarboxylate transporter receptor subunit TctC